MSLYEHLFIAVVFIVVLGFSFYPSIKRHRVVKPEQTLALIKRTLEKNDLKLNQSKKYHYDFSTNVLTIKP